MMTSRPVCRWMASTEARLVHAAGWMYTWQGVLLCCVVCMARTLGERFHEPTLPQGKISIQYLWVTFLCFWVIYVFWG